jgi:hypothetical protein
MIVLSAETVGDDLLLRDLKFYSTRSEFYASTILIYETKEFVSHRNKERAFHSVLHFTISFRPI